MSVVAAAEFPYAIRKPNNGSNFCSGDIGACQWVRSLGCSQLRYLSLVFLLKNDNLITVFHGRNNRL